MIELGGKVKIQIKFSRSEHEWGYIPASSGLVAYCSRFNLGSSKVSSSDRNHSKCFFFFLNLLISATFYPLRLRSQWRNIVMLKLIFYPSQKTRAIIQQHVTSFIPWELHMTTYLSSLSLSSHYPQASLLYQSRALRRVSHREEAQTEICMRNRHRSKHDTSFCIVYT